MIVSPGDEKLPANTVIIEDLPQKSKPISAGDNLLQEQDKLQTSSTQSEEHHHIAAVKNETSGVNVCPGVNLTVMKDITGDQAIVDSVGETLGTQWDEMHEKSRNDGNAQQDNSSGESTPQLETQKSKHDATKPTFRVTCNRAGENHSFDSMSAAASFGSAVQTYFGWNVDMKNFDIEVILNIDNEEVSVGIGLTRESLHYRNLVAFGPTTLRPTICHNMLRMCKIRDGHIVCDPMCGTGSISIQGSLAWPKTFQLCGENHPKALEKVSLNTQALNLKRTSRNQGTLKTDALRWDACHLPIRDSMVDIFVTDLPFGNRIGSRVDNRKLYPKILDEMARVGRAGARACLLTEDKTNIVKVVKAALLLITSKYILL
ncbi:hypothetical protein C0Q70_15002 [Pomacea canaliculata]|uniref:THUMP domain-containing protein n=1 Tax=Pomacea canaliculata TaxID=400727 RepID=A0A2T7NTM5_POMCA|nr:hypothetical protein C0Q70_15002 [Pomacea canaliculata]